MRGYSVISAVVTLSSLSVASANIFSPGTQFSGWYDAPLGFGRTDFTATVETYQETTGEFTASGTDKQGDFTLKGTVTGDDVRFVKDFTASDGYKDIKYSGSVEGEEVKGTYKFQYNALFISLPINENFYMKVTA